jgi:Rps23 Pro-64 3,4-dihydroxylase Tpa1-like proline 4-hydroxylase
LPETQALLARQEFLNADYDRIQQERRGYYSRDFAEERPGIPGADEKYYSEFYRSNYLEGNAVIRDSFHSYIKPIIETHTNKQIIDAELKCYVMKEGGHFRIHKDAYRSDIGFIWYLSQNWKWDWGGLLLAVNDDDTATVTMPVFNQLVIMDHIGGQVPHCVTPITHFALEPRIMLVGFLQSTGF